MGSEDSDFEYPRLIKLCDFHEERHKNEDGETIQQEKNCSKGIGFPQGTHLSERPSILLEPIVRLRQLC